MSVDRQLEPRPAPCRHAIPGPRVIHRSTRCINCGTCINACIYGCHERSVSDSRIMADPQGDCCRNCFACVLRCPRQALSMHANESYLSLGDRTYTPEVIRSTLMQASDGHLPVSGSGYGGPFDGPGFDGIWTDMSEIVRPTRDGIHGRERISKCLRSMSTPRRCVCSREFDGGISSIVSSPWD